MTTNKRASRTKDMTINRAMQDKRSSSNSIALEKVFYDG